LTAEAKIANPRFVASIGDGLADAGSVAGSADGTLDVGVTVTDGCVVAVNAAGPVGPGLEASPTAHAVSTTMRVAPTIRNLIACIIVPPTAV
jgi:hypothetical protein